MSEPVGNTPRGNIPGNSHKSREAEPASEPREKVEKVVSGNVVTKKPPFWRRLGRSIVAEDATNLGDYVLMDVIVPAVKNMLYDIVTMGAGRTLYGASRARRSTFGSGAGPVGAMKTAYHRVNEADRERAPMNDKARASHDFDQIVLETRGDAVNVLEGLISIVNHYGQVSVSDLYDLVGVSGSFADRRWGWIGSLDESDVRQVRGGFILDLPRPVELR